jgi:hypothetical protein
MAEWIKVRRLSGHANTAAVKERRFDSYMERLFTATRSIAVRSGALNPWEVNAMTLRTGVLIVLCCFLLTVFAVAQTPPGATEAIEVSVLVSDPSDRAVTGLNIKDFRVLEDQVLQTITSVKENKLAGDYTVSYTPKNSVRDGSWRKVRVEIAGLLGPRLTVRHSAGYSAFPVTR